MISSPARNLSEIKGYDCLIPDTDHFTDRNWVTVHIDNSLTKMRHIYPLICRFVHDNRRYPTGTLTYTEPGYYYSTIFPPWGMVFFSLTCHYPDEFEAQNTGALSPKKTLPTHTSHLLHCTTIKQRGYLNHKLVWYLHTDEYITSDSLLKRSGGCRRTAFFIWRYYW